VSKSCHRTYSIDLALVPVLTWIFALEGYTSFFWC